MRFIRPIVLILTLVAFPLSGWAQQSLNAPTLTHPSLSIGGTLGVSGSQVFFMPTVNESIFVGFTAGGIATLSNSNYTAFTAELTYSLRGWKELYNNREGNLQYSRMLHFIELPLLCHLYYPLGHYKVGLKMGPKVGYFLGENGSISGEGFTAREKRRHSLPIHYKFAWGLSGGPTFSFNIGKHSIELDALFYYGFNDIFSTTITDPYSKASEMQGVVKLNYLFRLL